MPLPEDVEARASEMLRAGSLSSSRFAEVEELSTYDKWRFVQACERAQDDKQPPFAGASVQGAAEGMPLSMAAEEPAAGAAAESLSQPLLPCLLWPPWPLQARRYSSQLLAPAAVVLPFPCPPGALAFDVVVVVALAFPA